MACEVTIKDIQKDIKNKLIDLLEDVGERATVFGDKIFVPFTVSNQQVLRSKVNEVNKKIEEAYHSEVFGKILYTVLEEEGLVVEIKPSQVLADAMTAQNYQDELRESGVDFFMGDILLSEQEEFGSKHTQNLKRPVTDNYVEFIRYKEAQLVQIKKDLDKINTAQKNPNSNKVELRKRAQQLAITASNISTQIEELKQNEVNLLFHAVVTDLELMDEALNTENPNLADIRKKLEFYNEFVTGRKYSDQRIETDIESLKHFGHEDYSSIVTKLIELSEKLTKTSIKQSREIVDNNVDFKNNLSLLTEDELSSLFQAQKDINWLEKMTLGIINSKTNDTILPQIYMSEFRRIFGRKYSFTQTLISDFKEFLDRSNLKDFDFIFERDSNNRKTGFIVDVFTPKWYLGLKGYENSIREFKKDKRDAGKYNEVNKWLRKNSFVIDFRKIQEFKEIYGDQYGEYFEFTDAQMERYEDTLKKLLGPRYNDLIQQLHNRLQEFEAIKESNTNSQNRYKDRNIAKNNIWEYNKKFHSGGNMYIQYLSGQSTYEVPFENFDALTIIPRDKETVSTDLGREEIDTEFYNQEFQDILTDKDKLEYWEKIKRMSEYINSTYGTTFYGRLSYPKVLKEYHERMSETMKSKSIKSSGKVLADVAHNYKAFFYEKGRHREDSEIVPNYTDVAGPEINALAKTYIMQGIEKTEAYSRASEEVLAQYSDDINKNIEAILMDAALHDARMEFEPIAQALVEDARNILDNEGNVRENSIERLEYHYTRVILNQTERYRDSNSFFGINLNPKDNWLNRAFKIAGEKPYFNKIFNEKSGSLLNDVEKKLYEELKKLQTTGASGGSTFNIKYGGATYIKDGTKYYYMEDGGTQPTEMTKENFDVIFKEYIQEKIDELGLDLNLAGIIQGILKTIVFKGLALNPISGIFNRIEGKHSGMIMDQTGYYWTKGNFAHASNFLSFANIIRLSPERIAPQNLKKYKELKKLEAFNKVMNVLQDRKNELQRSVDSSAYNRFLQLNPFSLAVENPEYKNQGAIFLSILMDQTIKDTEGNEVPIFNGSEFQIYELEGERLVLKPEFRTPENIENWENFSGEETFSTQLKMVNAVGKSQGNYDPLDIMMAKKDIWGRAATLFLTWFPEHFAQRFGTGQGRDLFTGQKRQSGRYTSTFKVARGASAAHTLGTLGILYGAFGLPVALVGGGLATLVYKKFFKNISSDEQVAQDANFILDFIQFYRSVLVQTLNYPLDMLNVAPSKRISDKAFEGRNLSDEELNNIQAMGKELAIMLTMLSLKLLAASMTWDDDDDEESSRRKFYNFAQNQLSRNIKSLSMYTDPSQFKDDMSRIAVLSYMDDTWKTVSMIWDEKLRKNALKNIASITPIPRILVKGELPWQDKKEYDKLPDMTGIPKSLAWSTDLYKDLSMDPETKAGKEYKKLRKERRDEIREEVLDLGLSDKEEIKALIDERMALEFPKKGKEESSSSILQRVQAGEKGEPSKPKKASRSDRTKRKEELKSQGLTDSEIAETMRQEFKGR